MLLKRYTTYVGHQKNPRSSFAPELLLLLGGWLCYCYNSHSEYKLYKTCGRQVRQEEEERRKKNKQTSRREVVRCSTAEWAK